MIVPPFLTVDGVRFPIVDGWTGPTLDARGAFEPLAWVVNVWLDGELPELVDALTRGDSVHRNGFGVMRVSRAEASDASRALWNELGGDEPGDDLVLATSVMTQPSFVVPRATLLALLNALTELRREAARWPRPATPAAAAPTSPASPAELFTQTPTGRAASATDRADMVALERRAAALDAAAAAATTGAPQAALVGERKAVLGALEWHGLLSDERLADKRTALEQWKLPVLLGYLDAAVALRGYLTSETRARHEVLDSVPQRLRDADVSLDWFRQPSPPPTGRSADEWLAFCEVALWELVPDGELGGLAVESDGRRLTIHWRTDFERPAVVSLAEHAP